MIPVGIAVLGLGLYTELRLTSTVSSMRETVDGAVNALGRVERTLQLLRIEQSSEGQGIDALLEKLAEFAPHMQRQTAYTLEYQDRMEEILGAVEALGPDSFPRILQAYRDSEAGEDDELRRWLLPAMVRADKERAKSFLVSVLRGVDPNYRSLVLTARNRQNAAMELVDLDKKLAGDLLAEIFSYESVRGVNVMRVPPELKDRVPAVGIGSGFDTLVTWYLETGHGDTETTLLRILKSNEHKLITKQIAVKELGARHTRAAADAIQKLYMNDPEGRANPLFLNHCLDALGKILRGEACEFFREQALAVDNEQVRNKLNELIGEYCGTR